MTNNSQPQPQTPPNKRSVFFNYNAELGNLYYQRLCAKPELQVDDKIAARMVDLVKILKKLEAEIMKEEQTKDGAAQTEKPQ